jgi:bifunctional UDP-N-acetylglucosamine pyrophosphorylase / glucosamine-1-phosphate N-acetyltransferase
MRSSLPKVLHPLCGRPLIEWPVLAAREAGAGKVVVVDNPKRRLAEHLPEDVIVAVQERPLGTGDAVAAAAEHIGGDETVLVTYGDVPLLTAEVMRALIEAHDASGAAATMATMELDDPSGYGRVLRAADGSVEGVVETKKPGDATEAELAIREVNTGVYAFEGAALRDALGGLEPANAQGELYLPDVLPLMRAAGGLIEGHVVSDWTVTVGVNDRVDLARARGLAQQRILEAHMRAGVTVVDPASTTIDVGVKIGQDTVIEPGCVLRGATVIGAECVIGPMTTMADAELGDRVSVLRSHVAGARLEAGVTVGPFAYLRPGAVLHEKAKAGTFVEIKNSDIGAGTKVPHLSYIGDADIGEGTNIAAGNIAANYDGQNKHRTTIGARVKTGVDTMFVAPVTIGDDAYTGAGSVIVEDVPPGALGIARERQTNIEGYADRRSRKQR